MFHAVELKLSELQAVMNRTTVGMFATLVPLAISRNAGEFFHIGLAVSHVA